MSGAVALDPGKSGVVGTWFGTGLPDLHVNGEAPPAARRDALSSESAVTWHADCELPATSDTRRHQACQRGLCPIHAKMRPLLFLNDEAAVRGRQVAASHRPGGTRSSPAKNVTTWSGAWLYNSCAL